MTHQKNPQNLHTPKNIHFSDPPPHPPPPPPQKKKKKNIENKNVEPPKMTRSYVCMIISEYPTPSHPAPGNTISSYQYYVRSNISQEHFALVETKVCIKVDLYFALSLPSQQEISYHSLQNFTEFRLTGTINVCACACASHFS